MLDSERSVGSVRPCLTWWGAIKLPNMSNTTHFHNIMAAAVANGGASYAPVEVSVPLPKAPRTDINLRLHDNGPNITLFLTTSTPDAASSIPLGSLVYAMPNVCVQERTT